MNFKSFELGDWLVMEDYYPHDMYNPDDPQDLINMHRVVDPFNFAAWPGRIVTYIIEHLWLFWMEMTRDGFHIVIGLVVVVLLFTVGMGRLFDFTAEFFDKVFRRLRWFIVPFINILFTQQFAWWIYKWGKAWKSEQVLRTWRETIDKYDWHPVKVPVTGYEKQRIFFKVVHNIDHSILDPLLAETRRVCDTKIAIVFVLIMFGLLYEVFGRYVNRNIRQRINQTNKSNSWEKKDTYEYIITLIDRLFASGIYLYPFIDVFIRNSMALQRSRPDIWPIARDVVGPLADWYIDHIYRGPLGGYTNTLLFFFIYYGVARNRDQIKFFTRYHAMQALMVNGLFIFVFQLGETIFYRLSDQTWDKFCVGLIWYIGALLTPMFFSALLGLETRIPFFDRAIRYHIGKRPPSKRKTKTALNKLDLAVTSIIIITLFGVANVG
jgi:hypothetical protein